MVFERLRRRRSPAANFRARFQLFIEMCWVRLFVSLLFFFSGQHEKEKSLGE